MGNKKPRPAASPCRLLTGCATLAERDRLEQFGQITQDFEQALRKSDYNTAARYLQRSAAAGTPDLTPCRNIKIVEYKILHVNVSADNLTIDQDVELQYFRLNSNIMRTARHAQTWRYREADQGWLLQSGLPDFGH